MQFKLVGIMIPELVSMKKDKAIILTLKLTGTYIKITLEMFIYHDYSIN